MALDDEDVEFVETALGWNVQTRMQDLKRMCYMRLDGCVGVMGDEGLGGLMLGIGVE